MISQIYAQHKKTKETITTGLRLKESDNGVFKQDAYQVLRTEYAMGKDCVLDDMKKKSVSFRPVEYVVTDDSPSLEPHETLETYEGNAEFKNEGRNQRNNLDEARQLKIKKVESGSSKESRSKRNLQIESHRAISELKSIQKEPVMIN